jgi:hypothetical protein
MPKSSCIGGSFLSDRQCRELRDTTSDQWADAVAIHSAIRPGHAQPGGRAQLRGQAHLHAALLPLDQADLATPEDHGQRALLNGLRADCQGVCGG